jgi:hypothetical protein
MIFNVPPFFVFRFRSPSPDVMRRIQKTRTEKMKTHEETHAYASELGNKTLETLASHDHCGASCLLACLLAGRINVDQPPFLILMRAANNCLGTA